MQEGTLFFLISWLAVWYIIFMGNGPARKRSRHLAAMLTILACAGISMNMVAIQVNFIWLPVIIWSLFQWRTVQKGHSFLVAVSVFGVMVTFACFRILTMLYPVWLIIDWKILCSLLVVSVSAIFQREWNLRMSTLFIGTLFGQVIFGVLLDYNGMPIGKLFSLEALDFLSLTVLINGLFQRFEQRVAKRAARKSLLMLAARNREMR